MKSLILIIGLISVFTIGESGILGENECAKGPVHWCGSIRNARVCKAVKHCIQTVWEKQILPEDNDDVCKICKDMVQQARDQLLSNETQEEIKEVFEVSCKLLPLTILQDECIKITAEYIPELIDTLASQMNPQAVCAAAQLCNNPYVDRILQEHEQDVRNSPVIDTLSDSGNCQDCKTFITDVVATVRKHSRTDVLDHLLSICGRLSSFSEGCMALVQNNFQVIYDFLATGLNPSDVCELFGMCDRMYGQSLVTLQKTGDEPCDFCVAIVNNWRNNLVANTTREEFKMILSGLCHQTRSFESECLSLVDQYFEVIYDILVSEIEPKEICKAIGLCGPNSIFKKDAPVWTTLQIRPEDHLPLVPLRPSFDNRNLIGLDEANSYRHSIHLPRVSLSRDSVSVVIAGETGVLKSETMQSNKCIMCEFVLHFLQNVLNDRQTRDEIEHAVVNVCNLFPHTLSEQCQDYIEAYGDQLIQLIILEIDPASICPMLNLCPGKRVLGAVKEDVSCVLCEFAMTELDEILKDKSNEEEIKQAVDMVCERMPKSIRNQCKTFIDTYIDQIVDLIVNDFTPNQICVQLGLCRSGKAPELLALPAPEYAQLPISRYFIPKVVEIQPEKKSLTVHQSPVCFLCEFIIARLDDLLLKDSTVSEIEKGIKMVCHLLPTSVRSDCVSFMEEYESSVLEYLVSRAKPEFMCRKLRLCKDSFSDALPKAVVMIPENRCRVCEKVVEFVEGHLTVQDSDLTVQNSLNNMCQDFPSQTAENTCVDISNTYGNFLAKLLVELKNAKRVCQAIKMCPFHGGKNNLLGAKKCTWGPSYWCQTQMHAEACQATDHCVDKVWMGNMPKI